MPRATINGASIEFEDQGTGQPVVLLHGFPLDRRIWDEQLATLPRSSRVIAVNMRGFGQSSNSAAFTMQSLADDIAALASYLKLPAFVLGGLSMGGYVVQALAKKYPRLCNGLILCCTKAEGDNEQQKAGRDAMANTARTQGAKAVADQMFPKMLAPDCAEHRPAIAKRLRQIMEACPPETIAHACAAMRDREDYVPQLSKIACPVLWITGELDAIVPLASVQQWAGMIPKCTLEIIKGSGHLAPMEQPEQVSRAIAQFVQNLKTCSTSDNRGCCG